MSLHIYFEGVDKLPALPVERDAEYLFLSVSLSGCDYDKAILKAIDKGEYLDSFYFTDRFGAKLSLDCLSTGAKAALCLYYNQELVLWGGEMGSNALTYAVRYCRAGHLLLPAINHCVLRELDDIPVDIVCKGRHYTSLDEFSIYMMEEAPHDKIEWV